MVSEKVFPGGVPCIALAIRIPLRCEHVGVPVLEEVPNPITAAPDRTIGPRPGSSHWPRQFGMYGGVRVRYWILAYCPV